MNLKLDEKCYTVKEVAQLLTVSIPTARRLIEQGSIRGINVCSGKRKIWRVTEQALKEYMGKDERVN